jgi:hypothetical protein
MPLRFIQVVLQHAKPYGICFAKPGRRIQQAGIAVCDRIPCFFLKIIRFPILLLKPPFRYVLILCHYSNIPITMQKSVIFSVDGITSPAAWKRVGERLFMHLIYAHDRTVLYLYLVGYIG